jgi:acyl transferase domain-containing protein/acyl carrier protein
VKKDIAIIGMSGRFPMAEDLAEFYTHLKEGIHGVRNISVKRKNETSLGAKDYMPSGFIEDVDKFDYTFFGISQGEAECMNPNQRLLLEEAYKAFENAGYNIDDFSGSKTNVYVSGPEFVYQRLIKEDSPTVITGNTSAMTAGMIARHFNLLGNAMLIDTTCSSSLVSVHLACQELLRGEAEAALVASANVIIFPPVKGEGIDIGIIAPDGKAKAFDHRADGSSCGETIACILLKRLEDAQKDGDTIHAIIKGSAVNQDANRSSFLTAPSKLAQAEVLKAAWENAAIHPETLGYIEAHGTGTKLGDPIEIDGMSMAFKSYTPKKQFCAVSSVKTNIGHTDRAAGLAGLIKAVLSIKNQQLLPSLHFEKPNPLIDFENAAVYVNSELKQWETTEGTPRRAGVSAFGLSGTNCHVVLEEATAEIREKKKEKRDQLFCLSSKTEEGLKNNINAITKYLSQPGISLDLNDISFTLNKGRKHYMYRHAFIADSYEDLLLNLKKEVTPEICPESKNELILTFSGHESFPEEILKSLCSLYPDFKSAYELCRELVNEEAYHTIGVKAFISYYSCFKLMASKGLVSENLMGLGLGELVVAVITKEITLETALKKASEYKETEIENLHQRLERYITSEAVRKTLYFLELAEEGSISKTLKDIEKENSPFKVFTLDLNHKADPFLQLVKSLYLSGFLVNWKGIYEKTPARRIPLPGYQFEKTRAWPGNVLNTNTIEDWFYELAWVKSPIKEKSETISKETLLLLMDEHGLGALLSGVLENENEVIKVFPSDRFEKVDKNNYRIDTQTTAHYKKLQQSLLEDHVIINGIVTLNYYQSSSISLDPALDKMLEKGIYAQFQLLKAFANYLSTRNFRLVSVTTRANKVQEGENVIPSNALSAVFLKALLAEYPLLKINNIDVTFEPENQLNTVKQIYAEMGAEATVRFASYRNNERYVPLIKRVKANPEKSSVFSPYFGKGTYIISGGASGIGYETALTIAREGAERIVILGRTVLPPQEEWSNYEGSTVEIRNRVNRLKAIIALGTEVIYHAIDVSDNAQVTQLLDQIKAEDTQINGVIHAAGLAAKNIPFAHLSFDDFKHTLAAKVQGTENLSQLPAANEDCFFVAYSSLNSIVPQRQTVDYAVANAYEDAMALARAGKGQKWRTIGWPGWYETGMSVKDGQYSAEEANHFPLMPLSNEQGLTALRHAFRFERTRAHILVANINLKAFSVNPYFLVESGDVSNTEPESTEALKNTTREQHLIIPEDFTATEGSIARIWAEVLKIKSIQKQDNFFDLGGHSLNGTQVMNRIEKELGVVLEFEDLYDYATVETLSGKVDELLATSKSRAFGAIEPLGKQDYYNISHAQRRLWILQQLQKEQTVYNLPFAFELKDLDLEAFIKAFDSLEARHESLRTTFVNLEGIPKQKIHPPGALGFKINIADLSNDPDLEKKVQHLLTKDAKKVFDLEKGPLIRATLIKTGPKTYTFSFTIHHIICDGWSLKILMTEMMALYTAFANGQEQPLAPLRVQYKDYVGWQDKLTLEKEEKYWLKTLAGSMEFVDLPVDYVPEHGDSTFNGQVINETIDEKTTAGLRALAKQQNTSLSNVVLAVFNIFLHSITGQENILIGLAIANRNHLDIEHMIGFFVNTLIIKNTITEDQTFEQVIKNVSQNVLEAYEHQNYPFDLLVEKLNPDRMTNRQPLFNVMYTFQNYADINMNINREEGVLEMKSTALSSRSLDLEVNNAYFDLTHFVLDEGNCLQIGFNYNSDLFEHSTIQNLLEDYKMFFQDTVKMVSLGEVSL